MAKRYAIDRSCWLGRESIRPPDISDICSGDLQQGIRASRDLYSILLFGQGSDDCRRSSHMVRLGA
jgi:hypothetical protein